MARPLRLLNLLLALLALALLGALVNSIVDRHSSATDHRLPTTNHRPSTQAPDVEKPPFPLKPSPPPLSDFDVILKQDPFKNPFAEVLGKPEVQKPPPPLPLPTLLGTIFVGEERKAILKDGGRAEIYALGQAVAGGTLVEIKEDRVLIQRGETLAEILLKASIQPVPPPAASGSSELEEVEEAPTVEAPPLPVPSVQRPLKEWEKQGRQKGLRREERLRRLQERLQQRQQRFQGQ